MIDTEFQELWKKVLRQAQQHYIHGPTEEELQDYARVAGEDAEAWIDSNSEEVGSFVWVCDLLDLEPSAVRAAWRKKRKETKGEV